MECQSHCSRVQQTAHVVSSLLPPPAGFTHRCSRDREVERVLSTTHVMLCKHPLLGNHAAIRRTICFSDSDSPQPTKLSGIEKNCIVRP